MNILQMFNNFKVCNKWDTYSPQTQRQYTYLIANALEEQVCGVTLKDMDVSEFNTDAAIELYTKVSAKGTTVANQTKTAFNALFSTFTGVSPYNGLKLRPTGKLDVTISELRSFLTVAYSRFKWRNAGLILQLSFEQGQPVSDILNVTWDDVSDDSITINGITTPLSDAMQEMLAQQRKDFDFQPYVVPNPHPFQGEYRPYGVTQISRTIGKIKMAAGLGSNFTVAEVRRLGLASMARDGFTKDELITIGRLEGVDRRTVDSILSDM